MKRRCKSNSIHFIECVKKRANIFNFVDSRCVCVFVCLAKCNKTEHSFGKTRELFCSFDFVCFFLSQLSSHRFSKPRKINRKSCRMPSFLIYFYCTAKIINFSRNQNIENGRTKSNTVSCVSRCSTGQSSCMKLGFCV